MDADAEKIWEEFMNHRTVTSKSLKDIFDLERDIMSRLFKDECKSLLVDITTLMDDRLGLVNERIGTIEQSMVNVQSEISVIQKEIQELKSTVSDLKKTANDQSDEIAKLQSENEALKSLPDDSSLRSSISKLEERVEDRTNRQLRKTLTITGIQEIENESWTDTKKLVAKTISGNLNIKYDDAFDMLERVHRSAPTTNASKIGRRDIFAAIYDWNDCEFLTRKFRNLNGKNRNLKIHFNYKYGPLTTRRRNAALYQRRKLFNEKMIVQGYLSFPAKLLVKRSNDDDFEVYEDFSKLSLEELESRK